VTLYLETERLVLRRFRLLTWTSSLRWTLTLPDRIEGEEHGDVEHALTRDEWEAVLDPNRRPAHNPGPG
jgi:hypothetical protein